MFFRFAGYLIEAMASLAAGLVESDFIGRGIQGCYKHAVQTARRSIPTLRTSSRNNQQRTSSRNKFVQSLKGRSREVRH